MERVENCPDCGRELVRVHDNGSFDLAGKASARFVARVPMPPAYLFAGPVEIDAQTEAVEGSAVCLRWRCRLRRWWRGVIGDTVEGG